MNLQQIKRQLSKVIEYSQDIPDPKVDNLVDTWYNNKKKFIDMFGGEPIYEVPGIYHFELDKNTRDEKLSDFCERLSNTYSRNMLAAFVEAQADGFFSNVIVNDFNYNGIHIKKGTKLIKTFKYFIQNKDLLELIQNEASRIIQEEKVEGTLCFSVHPLDFLSSSQNGYNWRSCHSLDGEYRAGNLSYMLDKCSFMCYLKGEKDQKIPLFPDDVPWNSKKWRVLLYTNTDDDILLFGRQYPFSSWPGAKDIMRIYKETFNKDFTDLSWEYDFPNGTEHRVFPGGIDERSTLENIVRDKSCLHYNDLLRSSFYMAPYYAFKPSVWDNFQKTHILPESLRIEVGYSPIYCLRCGQEVIENPGVFQCDDCEIDYGNPDDSDYYSVCDCCGCRYVDDEMIYMEDGSHICPDCFDEQGFICDCCGGFFYNEEEHYDEDTGEYLCNSCFEGQNE